MLSLEFRLILAVLACYRISQLIVYDDGFLYTSKMLREFVGKRAAYSKIAKHFADLINCPYCVGIWIAMFLVILVFAPTFIGNLILLIFGIAGGQAFLQTLGDNYE